MPKPFPTINNPIVQRTKTLFDKIKGAIGDKRESEESVEGLRESYNFIKKYPSKSRDSEKPHRWGFSLKFPRFFSINFTLIENGGALESSGGSPRSAPPRTPLTLAARSLFINTRFYAIRFHIYTLVYIGHNLPTCPAGRVGPLRNAAIDEAIFK
jgi:hypothetical protein